jgi:hypothetical protein
MQTENKYAMQPYMSGALPQASSKPRLLDEDSEVCILFIYEFLCFKLILYLVVLEQ